MEEEILDFEVVAPEFIRFRKLPILIEALPLLVGLIGLAIGNNEMKAIGFITSSAFYILLAWYFFKGLKHSFFQVFASTFFGIGISTVLLGILFYIQDWDEGGVMVNSCNKILNFFSALSLGYMILKSLPVESRKYEFRMTQKIFSRYVILFIIYVFLGLK